MKKRIFVVFVCVLTTVAFLSSAWAIDRGPKSKGSEDKKKPVEFKQIKEKTKRKERYQDLSSFEKIIQRSETPQKLVPQKSERSGVRFRTIRKKEKYDYFIDKNNNGIDDRLERKLSKSRERTVKKRPLLPSKKIPEKISPSNRAPEEEVLKMKASKKEPKVKRTDKKSPKDRK